MWLHAFTQVLHRQDVNIILESSDSENEETVDACILPPNDGADSDVEVIYEDLSHNEPADVAVKFKFSMDTYSTVIRKQRSCRGSGNVLGRYWSNEKRNVKSDQFGQAQKQERQDYCWKVKRVNCNKFSENLPQGNPLNLADSHPELIYNTSLDLLEKIFTLIDLRFSKTSLRCMVIVKKWANILHFRRFIWAATSQSPIISTTLIHGEFLICYTGHIYEK